MLEHRLAAACEGEGSVVVIEAPAGKGKSRLLTIAGDMAREAGMRVLGAHGSELERDFPFGVAIQLFEPRWIAADPDERARLLRDRLGGRPSCCRGSRPIRANCPTTRATR